MKITKIEIQKKKPNRRSIYIDGKYAFEVNVETLLQFNLVENDSITQKKADEIQKAEEKRACKESALNLLSYRMRTEKEMNKRLKEKKYNEEVIEEVIEELKRINLINDLEFAQAWIRERGNSYGKFKLRNELCEKGVPEDIIDTVLSDASIDESDIARNLAQKWLKSHKTLSPDVLKRRLAGFLLRRGISYDTINSIPPFTRE